MCLPLPAPPGHHLPPPRHHLAPGLLRAPSGLLLLRDRAWPMRHLGILARAIQRGAGLPMANHKRLRPLPPLLLLLPMLLPLLLLLPWLALGAVPVLALGTLHQRACRPPPHGLAPPPHQPPNRGLPANNNEANAWSHFWYGMCQASRRSLQFCMRPGSTLRNLML